MAKNISNKSNYEKIADLQFIFDHVAITSNNNLFEKEDIEDFEKDFYNLDIESDNDSDVEDDDD